MFSVTAARANQEVQFDLDKVAKGNEHAVRQFFAMHKIKYDLKNFMSIASGQVQKTVFVTDDFLITLQL